MSFDKEIADLAIERKRSVTQIAKHWGNPSFLLSPETPHPDSGRPGLSGRQLLSRLIITAKELQGRVVGKNGDDVTHIRRGLDLISEEWDALEKRLQSSEQALFQERRHPSGLDSARSPSASSPDSTDSQYVAKQHHRIQQLEAQEAALEKELQQLKAKWEAIMAKTMEQQAAVHRQQMQEREALVAKKEAEIRELRRRLPDAANPKALLSQPVMSQPSAAQQRPSKRTDQYLMAGRMMIGQTLQILGPCDESAPEKLQWYRVSVSGAWEPISGATRKQYSPEPFDVGLALGCCITSHGSPGSQNVTRVSSKQPVAPYPGFEEWVDSLAAAGGAQFRVIVVQRNGMLHTNREPCILEVTRTHLALRMPNAVTLQQPFHTSMKVCGARGAGDAAAQGVFLAIQPNDVYMLACETARERNACIMLVRKMASGHGLSLNGPEEP